MERIDRSRRGRLAACAALFGMVACATPDQIAKQPVSGVFTSSLSPKKLASCIDRNAENRVWAGAFRSKVRDDGTEPITVIVHASTGWVSTIAEVRSANDGSKAEFRFGGAAQLDEALKPGSVMNVYVAGCN